MGTSQTRPACSPSRAGMSREGVWLSFTRQQGRQGQQGSKDQLTTSFLATFLSASLSRSNQPHAVWPLAGSSARWHPDYAVSDRAENSTTPN
ncbi:hypothetical protein KL918_005379 [Ogataea parapolymorpha]|nr:hypothetical protein KL918_005379 [Ogataea parapolymorpha]KAG7868490.1 hypothetical protein KL916_005266 [Ogataea parapolymorpha]